MNVHEVPISRLLKYALLAYVLSGDSRRSAVERLRRLLEALN